MEQREQSDACIDIAESRQKSTEGQLMSDSQIGGDRLPAAVPSSAKVIHKTGTGYPLPSGMSSGICDVGIIILDNGQQLPIAVFITNPSSQSRISDVAKQLLRMGKTAKIIPEVETD
jgi:beta-lactamase class A